MNHANILQAGALRWAVGSVVVLVLGMALYWAPPLGLSRSGNSWQGYGLGAATLFLVLVLSVLGMRKRAYQARGRVQNWVSAHIVLGVLVVPLAILHSGGQLGWNVHSLAFVLLTLTSISGMVGLGLYLLVPGSLQNHRQMGDRQSLLSELIELEERCADVSAGCSEDVRVALESAFQLTEVQGSFWQTAFALDRSTFERPVAGETRRQPNVGQRPLIEFLASTAASVVDGRETDALRRLVAANARRAELLRRLRRDLQLQTLLDRWLLVHVPLTGGLLGATAVHLFAVFFYW